MRRSGELLPRNIMPVPQFDSWQRAFEGEDQANLTSFAGCCRFSIKAARRAPRAHGIWGISSFAAVTTDLMKRGLVI